MRTSPRFVDYWAPVILLSLPLVLVPLLVSSRFIEPFVDPKWIFLHFCMVGLIAWQVSTRREWLLPRFSTSYLVCVALGCIALLFHCAIRSPIPGWTPLFRLATITFCFYSAFAFFREGRKFEFLLVAPFISMFVVTSIGYIQLLLPWAVPPLLRGYNDSTLGYPNVTAEYLGLSLIFSLRFLPLLRVGYRSKVVLLCGSALACAYIIFLSSRAVWVGFSLGTLVFYLILRRGYPKKFGTKSLLLPMIFLALTLGIFYPTLQRKWDDGFWKTKKNNVGLRWHRWKNVVQMIRENPMGVGLGRFGYAYLDYHEGKDPEVTRETFVDSSHNLWLDMIVELGIPLSILLIFCGILTVNRALLECRGSAEDLALFGGAAVYLLTVSFVAYPWRNPSVCMLAALIWAWAMRNSPISKRTGLVWMPLLLIPFGYYLIGYTLSSYVALKPSHHYPFSRRVVLFYPFSLENRFAVARYECLIEEVDRCRDDSLSILKSEPNYLWAYETLAESFSIRGEKRKACTTSSKTARLDYSRYNEGQESCDVL